MDEENVDEIREYALLGFILLLIGYLVFAHTGQEQGQLSPQFWAGAALPILIQLIRKTFNLKKSNGKG